ncbi:ferritin-like domain-containing protein [Myxococcus sp. K38C18041901]|uniref:ferritin-like domain-containing protein n=1 Tax=Myxococcus guangdongensis TaxID=2906760 RepID=UPI0020A81B78|nr:ferritin-like domain-containing protein [Myxococcus guangdongensis]MCP3060192.1 ferritin-like domain-containing protein [Myxococcus guangdongensis]
MRMALELAVILGCAAVVSFILGIVFALPRNHSQQTRRLGGRLLIGGGVLSTGAVVGAAWAFFEFLSSLSYSKGRVLRLQGRARVARRALGTGWADEAVPEVSGLTAWQRTVLGELWMYSARMEHASVPAFAKLSLRLSALGAPSALLEDCHLAALDEVRHARRCFALARAYSGMAWTAGPIPELGQDGGRPQATASEDDWARLARGSLLDGCLAEGLASLVAAEGARRASDPVVRETLSVIAEDEGRHAELGWDVLDFALERGGGSAKAGLRRALAELDSRSTPALPPIPGMDEAFLARNGLLPQAELGHWMGVCIQQTRARALALLTPGSAPRADDEGLRTATL